MDKIVVEAKKAGDKLKKESKKILKDPKKRKAVKKAAKTTGKTILKTLIVLPFAMLSWDYYETRDVRRTANEAFECFAWPAGIFVVKHFRPNPF